MLASSSSFLRQFMRDPRATGAIAPATKALSRSVAAATAAAYASHEPSGAKARSVRLLELGAGTGALTQSLAPLRPILVEREPRWARLLRQRFPALDVREQCAMHALQDLSAPTGIVCSIPLWNNPQSRELKRLLGERYAAGLIHFCVLYTYGWSDPLAGGGFRSARRTGFVVRSLPPAHVWLYQ